MKHSEELSELISLCEEKFNIKVNRFGKYFLHWEVIHDTKLIYKTSSSHSLGHFLYGMYTVHLITK